MMQLNQKGAVDIAFVTVLVILVVAAAFTLWKMNAADEAVSEADVNTSSQSSAESQEPISDTQETIEEDNSNFESGPPDGWIKFTSTELDASFYYPSEWSIEDEDGNSSNGVTVTLRPNQGSATVSLQNYIFGFGAPKYDSLSVRDVVYDHYRLGEGTVKFLREGAEEGTATVAEVNIIDESNNAQTLEETVIQIINTISFGSQ